MIPEGKADKVKKSAAYAKMMELNDFLGGDDLVEAILKGMLEDFSYGQCSQ